MKVTHKIDTDLQIRKNTPRLTMVQCDYDSREIEITMTSGGIAWIPEHVESVFLRYRKSDGTGGSYDTLPDGTSAWMVNGNKIVLQVVPQMLTVPGLVEAQAVITSGKNCIATFGFQVIVEADPSADAVHSDNYFNWSDWAKEEIQRLLELAQGNGDFKGTCFFPVIDEAGTLSWTNDGGEENPESVNLVDLIASKINSEILQGNLFGDVNMNGYRIKKLANPEAPDDAATKEFVMNMAEGPENLLDNSDFTNPVNQRKFDTIGYTSTDTYCIDRWFFAGISSGDSVTLSADGIVCVNALIQQRLPLNALKSGKKYTAVLIQLDGTPLLFTNPWIDYNHNGAGYNRIVFYNISGTFKCAALYEGEYTYETLPKYRPRGYAMELAECLKYFERKHIGLWNITQGDVFVTFDYTRKRISGVTTTYDIEQSSNILINPSDYKKGDTACIVKIGTLSNSGQTGNFWGHVDISADL